MTRSNGAAPRIAGRDDAVRLYDSDNGTGVIAPGIVTRGAHGGAVDIGGEYAAAHRARRGDGEDAGAGAEVENALRVPPPGHPIEREETAARRAVMAGAEGERSLDFDADPVDGNFCAIVRAMNDKAAGLDRLEPGEAFGDPILCRDAFELWRTFAAGPGRCRQSPHSTLVRHTAKMNDHAPAG